MIKLSLLALVVSLFAGSVFAQARGTISGRLTDPAGAVVPGASVTVTNTGTSVSRNTSTNAEGLFNVPALDPGVYDLRVEKSGFSPATKVGVNLLSDTTLTLDFALSVAGSTQQVEVAGDSPLVEITQSAVSGSLQTSEVQNLPILNRNWTGLVTLIPGARPAPAHNTTKQALGNSLSFGGGSGRNVEVNVDGIDNRDDIIGGPMMNFTLEGIQEFKVLSHEFSAQYGRTDGAVVEVVSKSGTNHFHGSAFGYGRNDALTAIDYFSEPAHGGAGKPSYSRENFGGSFGGPIKRDKVFFFGAVERVQQNLVQTEPVALYQQAVLLARYLPAAGVVPAQTIPIPFRDNMYTLKGDYQINQHHSLFVRWAQQINNQDNDLITTTHPDLSVSSIDTNHLWSIVGSETWLIGSNAVNTFGFQRNEMNTVTGIPGGLSATIHPIIQNLTFPSVGTGTPTSTTQNFLQSRYQFRDDYTRQIGAHSLRIGGDFSFYPQIDIRLDIGLRGQITFLKDPSAIVALPQGFATPGLISTIVIGDRAAGGPPADSNTSDQRQFGVYVQDDWKLRPSFTLNLGLRYDLDINWYDQPEIQNNRTYLALKAVGSPYGKLPQTPTKDFSPRFGFAWDVAGNGKNVIRGGFGIYFDQWSQSYAYSSNVQSKPTLALATTYVAQQLTSYVYGQPLPAGPPALPTQLPPQGNISGTVIDPNVTDPYDLQYHIGYTRQLTPNMVLSTDYTHIQGVHEVRFAAGLNINPIESPAWDPNATSYNNCGIPAGVSYRRLQCQFAAAVQNNPGLIGLTAGSSSITRTYKDGTFLGAITDNPSNSRSRFDEYIVHLERRGRRITLQGTYTLAWSDAFGGCLGGGGGGGTPYTFCQLPVNQFAPTAPSEWGPTVDDERHRGVISAVVNLPWNLQVSPIFQVGSARPYTLTNGFDCNGDGTNNDRAFVSTSTGKFVTCPTGGAVAGVVAGATQVGINSQRMTPTWDFDTRVTRIFRLGSETRTLGLFAEFYNITNKANFGNYNGNVQAAIFEQPTAYFGGYPTSRQMQLGARLNF